jgi:hypothetical protein
MGSSSGGNGGDGDVLEHREANWGVRHGSIETDEGGMADLTEGREKR